MNDSSLFVVNKPSQPAAISKIHLKSLATEYFELFNRNVFESKLDLVTITWSRRLLTTAGKTLFTRGAGEGGKDKLEIQLSTKVLDDLEKLKVTLLHEMVHCAVFQIDRVKETSHGKAFKTWAKKAQGITKIEVTTKHQFFIHVPHQYRCLSCGQIFKRHSDSIDVQNESCPCKGLLTYLGRFDKEGTKTVASKKEPTKLFLMLTTQTQAA